MHHRRSPILEAPEGRLIVLVGENRIHDTIALRVRQLKDYATKDGGLPTTTLANISTMAQSINAGGAVTGYYQDITGFHGFVRRDELGELISFDPPGSIQTMATSINAKGDITGTYLDASFSFHGFVRRPGGEIVSFDAPGAVGTFASSINDKGAITGTLGLRGSGPGPFAFVRSPEGTITQFDPPFCQISTISTSINDEGVITGWRPTGNPPPAVGAIGWVRFP